MIAKLFIRNIVFLGGLYSVVYGVYRIHPPTAFIIGGLLAISLAVLVSVGDRLES